MHGNRVPPISLFLFARPSYPSPKQAKATSFPYFFDRKTKKRSGKNIHLQRIVYICKRDQVTIFLLTLTYFFT